MSKSQLTPFWYTPEGQDASAAVSFQLRPLTQPQMVDVEEHAEPNTDRISRKGQWIAGSIGIVSVKGAAHPETGEAAAMPECLKWINRHLVRMCGLRLIANDAGLDWHGVIRSEPQDDPEKN